MKWMKRILAVLLLVIAVTALTWQFLSGRVEEWARRVVVDVLSENLHSQVRLGALRLSAWPLRVQVSELTVGEELRALVVERAAVRLSPIASLLQRRPVLSITAHHVIVDPSALSVGEPASQTEPTGFSVQRLPFRIRRVLVTDSRVRIPVNGNEVEISVQRLAGYAQTHLPSLVLQFGVRVADLEIRRGGDELRIEAARLRGSRSGEGFLVEDLTVDGDGIDVTVTGAREKGELRHEVAADVELEKLVLIDESLAGLAGQIRIEGTQQGPLAETRAEGRFEVFGLSLSGRELGGLQGQLKLSGNDLEVVSLKSDAFGGAIDVAGSLQLDRTAPFEIEGSWRDVATQQVASFLGVATPIRPVLDGKVRVEGKLTPLSVKLDAKGTLTTGGAAVAADWSVDGQYLAGGSQAVVRLEQSSSNRADVKVMVSRGGHLNGHIDVRIDDGAHIAQLLQIGESVSFHGPLAVVGELSGTASNPVFAGQIGGERLEVAGSSLEKYDALLMVGTDRVEVDDLVVQIGGGTVEAQGTVALASEARNDWHVRLHDVESRVILRLIDAAVGFHLPVEDGRLTGTLSGEGPWSAAVIAADVHCGGLRIWDEPFAALDVQLDTALPRWDGNLKLVHEEGENLHARLKGVGADEVVVDLDSNQWNLARLNAGPPRRLGGNVALSGHFEGPVNALEGRLELKIDDARWGQQRVGGVVLNVQASAGEWIADGRLDEHEVSILARMDSGGGMAVHVRSAWKDAPVTLLLGLDSSPSVIATGTLELGGTLSDINRLGGTVQVTSLSVAQGAKQLRLTGPVTARLEGGRWTTDAIELEHKRGRLKISGGGTLTGAFDLGIEGRGEVGLLEMLSDTVESARGHFDLEVDLQRSEDSEYSLNGQASFEDVAVDVGLAVVPRDTSGRVTLSGTEIHFHDVAGRAGGGLFEIGGMIDVVNGPNLTWKVDGISTSALPGIEDEISGDGSVSGSWEKLEVAGEVNVLQLLYEENVGLKNFIPWLTGAMAPSPGKKTKGPTVLLDLHVNAPGNLFIDNNVAKAELRADLRITGNTNHIRLDGPVEVLQGEVMFQKRKFEVTSGLIKFRPDWGTDAALNLTAETVVPTGEASYTVSAQVIGTTTNYRVLLSSDDAALSQTDIVSLIAFGKTRAQLQESGGGISTGNLMELGDGLYGTGEEGGVARIFRIDRVEVEPTFSTTGALEPRLAVTKEFTEDLSGLVTTTFGAETRQSAEMEYRLTDKLSVVGVWESETRDETGAVGGGLKFTYPFRRVPRLTILSPCFGGNGEEND